MKKLVIIFALIFLFFPTTCGVASAEQSSEEIESELQQSTTNQINELDLIEVEEVLKDVDTTIFDGFNVSNVGNLIDDIVNERVTISFTTFFSSLLKSLAKAFNKMLPFIGIMLGIILLASMLNKIKTQSIDSGVSQIVFFACYTSLVLVIFALVSARILDCNNAIYKMKSQMQAIFPILLVLMTAGGATSVKMFQPAVATLSGVVSTIFSSVLLPLVIVMFVISIVSNLSDNVRLAKFQDFISSVFKWIIGIVSTLFMAYLSVNGITAATKDGISIRTAKYAIKSYVPIIGGYISEGFELVMASSILIKNGVGVLAIVLLLATVLAPVCSIIVLSLTIKLVAAVVEPVADKKFCSFLSSCGKTLNLLCVVLVGVALMYFLTIALFIVAANGALL